MDHSRPVPQPVFCPDCGRRITLKATRCRHRAKRARSSTAKPTPAIAGATVDDPGFDLGRFGVEV
jgi:hypothetical protein